MRNIRLYIGGKRADLDENTTLPFTYQTSDAEMPTAVKNSYSKTVSLPGTDTNRRIFGGLWRLDSMARDESAAVYRNATAEQNVVFSSRTTPSLGNGVKVTKVRGNSTISNGVVVNNSATGIEMYSAGGTSLGTFDLPITTNTRTESVYWNQRVKNTDSATSKDNAYCTYDASTGLWTYKNVSRTTNFGSGSSVVAASGYFTSGHLIYIKTDNLEPGICVGMSNHPTIAIVPNTIVTMEGNYYFWLRVTNLYDFVTEHPIGNEFSFRLMFFDLTDMFGSGNEPTLSECRTIFNEDYYEYDAGTQKNIDIPLFLDGLCKVNGIYDEMTPTTATKRIGAVNLGGVENWVVYSNSLKIFRGTVTDMSTSSAVLTGLCADYTVTSDNVLDLADKTIRMVPASQYVYVRDTSCANAIAFSFAAGESILYYELDTEQTYSLSTPLSEDYVTCAAGGTQKRLPYNSSVADMDCDFEYATLEALYSGFNPMKKVDFLLYVDEMIVERGYCQLTSINRKSRDYTFNLSLFGGLGEFFYNLQTDSDGETRSLADMTWTNDLGFTVNATNVQAVWDDVIGGNLPDVAFVPMHNGVPDHIDGDKMLIAGGGVPTSVTDSGTTYTTKDGYLLASCERKYTEWEVGDLRSYLQRPALRLKTFLDTCFNPVNNGGWTVDADSNFFSSSNPYYYNTYITLPLLNVEESTEEICNDGTLGAVNQLMTSDSITQTLTPSSSCMTLSGNYIDLSAQASNSYLTAAIPIQTKILSMSNYGDIYLAWRATAKTYLFSFCYQAVAYDDDGNVIAQSPRYVFCTKNHHGEVPASVLQKPTATIPGTTDAQVEGCFKYSSGEYTFVQDTTNANTFVLQIDKIPRPSSTNKQVRVDVIFSKNIQYYAFNTSRKGSSHGRINGVDVTTQFQESVLSGSNNYVYLTEPTQYASDSKVTQTALLNSLDCSPLDLLLSVTKTFGLMWLQDNQEKTVRVFQRTSFYTGEVSDIHNRIDYSKGLKVTPVVAESNVYTLENEYPETDLSEAYESDYGRTYGGVRLNVGYDFGEDKIETMEKVKLLGYVDGALSGSGYWTYTNSDGDLPSAIADGMKVTYYYTSGNDTSTKDIDYNLFNVSAVSKANSPVLGVACKSDDGEPEAEEIAPSLVFYTGSQISGNYFLSDDITAMATLNNGPCYIWDNSRTAARIPKFARVATFSSEVYSLDFGTPKMTYYIPDVALSPEQAIYSRYWKKYLTDLLSKNTKKVECYVVFPPHLDMREEMRKFYLFDRSLWVLNKVSDYDATKTQSVKCEFIRVNYKDNYLNY